MGIFSRVGYFLLFAGCCLCGSLHGEETKESASDPQPLMDYTDAAVYGLVEGVTEFLPISSTGHLILTKEWMSEKGVAEAEVALNAYLIVIQFGAILAVGLLYWREIWAVILGVVGLDPRGRSLGLNLLFAFLPAAALGPLLDEFIEETLFGAKSVAVALILGALLMFWAERMRTKRENGGAMGKSADLAQLSSRSAFFIGFMQCVAMCPGTSRSMMTIVGGYFVGLRPAKAAEFSFLLGLVTLSAAAGYKVITKGEEMRTHLDFGPVLVGCLLAGVSAAFAVRWLVTYLAQRGLGLFAWYRLGLAAIVLALA
jgi:undecaprenyl-diphosphatase